jgi:CRP/FNR family transcriptional regulator
VNDAAAIIDRSRLFGRLSPTARARLHALARPVEAPPRQMLFRQGDPCPGLFVVGSGLVRVYKLAPNGREHILHLAGPGQTFAEAAVIGGFACPAFAETVELTRLAHIATDDFLGFLRADHGACIDLLAGMAQWLHHVVDLLEDVALRDAAGRLARALADRAGADGTVWLASARKHLAAHLNLTPETLSRTLRRFIDDGLISDGDPIRILDQDRLRAVSEGQHPRL